MGYYCEGHGTIMIKNNMDSTQLVQNLNKIYREGIHLKYNQDDDVRMLVKKALKDYANYGTLDDYLFDDKLELSYRGNYHDDEFIKILNAIQPYIEEGTIIEFKGQEDDYWKFENTPNGIKEVQGELTYNEPQKDLSSLSTDELLKELANRLPNKIKIIENNPVNNVLDNNKDNIELD